MLLDIVFIIVGLVFILLGANGLTDGASAVAKRFGLSDLVVGLTIVAFGTSTPELVISVTSAVHGSAGLAIGNAVGSNVFNILVIVGVTALFRPLTVGRSIMTREIPMVIISSLVLLIMVNSRLLDGESASVLTRGDGLILILFFIIFMWYVLATAKKSSLDAQPDAGAEVKLMPVWKSIVWIVGGLAMLIFGGEWFVDGATGLAQKWGVSDAVIGLTIAAAGTSLPELATSIVAALKGKTGLAVGNVVGSCIFNIFMVLGLSATLHPLPFGSIGNLDLLTLAGASLLFLCFGWLFGERKFTRMEGGIMVLCYVGYVAVLIMKL